MKKVTFLTLPLLFFAFFFISCNSDNQITSPFEQPSTLKKSLEIVTKSVDYQLYDGSINGIYLPEAGVMPYYIGMGPYGRTWTYQDLTFYSSGDLIGYFSAGTPARHLGANVWTTGAVRFVLPTPATTVSVFAYDDIYGWWANGTILTAYNANDEQLGMVQTTASGYNQIAVTAPAGKSIDYFTLRLKYISGKWYQPWIHFGNLTVVYIVPEIQVNFDVLPDVINSRNKGVTPTAVYSSAEFDASTIDILTLTINGSPITEAHGKAHFEDLNNDGLIDITLHFNTGSLGLVAGNFEVTLKGKTLDGKMFYGKDIVVVK